MFGHVTSSDTVFLETTCFLHPYKQERTTVCFLYSRTAQMYLHSDNKSFDHRLPKFLSAIVVSFSLRQGGCSTLFSAGYASGSECPQLFLCWCHCSKWSMEHPRHRDIYLSHCNPSLYPLRIALSIHRCGILQFGVGYPCWSTLGDRTTEFWSFSCANVAITMRAI